MTFLLALIIPGMVALPYAIHKSEWVSIEVFVPATPTQIAEQKALHEAFVAEHPNSKLVLKIDEEPKTEADTYAGALRFIFMFCFLGWLYFLFVGLNRLVYSRDHHYLIEKPLDEKMRALVDKIKPIFRRNSTQ